MDKVGKTALYNKSSMTRRRTFDLARAWAAEPLPNDLDSGLRNEQQPPSDELSSAAELPPSFLSNDAAPGSWRPGSRELHPATNLSKSALLDNFRADNSHNSFQINNLQAS